MTSLVPPFEHTSMEAIPGIVNGLRDTFHTQKTRPIEFRLRQLRKLYWGLVDYTDAFVEALRLDLHRPLFEIFATEIDWCKNDIIHVCNNLARWAKDEAVEGLDLPTRLTFKPVIRKDPLGCVLIIGTYNFPMQLLITPAIGAIAAGNTVVMKPSENAPHVAAVIHKVVSEYLDNSCYTVVQGAVAESTALLDQKWDKIFYTGGTQVGKIVAKKAAETLTPVGLELGGLNPAFITKKANLHLAARRLLWGKIHCAGQVCVSQNYILVDKEVLPTLVEEFKQAYKQFYPNGAKGSEDYTHIATPRAFQRIKGLVDNSRGRILMGGLMDEKERFIEPTLIQVDDIDDPVIQEESFGPLIVLLPVDDLDSALRIANTVDTTPLAAYAFGSKQETDKVLTSIRSGGATVNDSFAHIAFGVMPLGGVGTSGYGSYRGKASFDEFVHRRSMLTTPSWADKFIGFRYPPYTASSLKMAAIVLNKRPNFDREGNKKSSVLNYAGSVVALALAVIGVKRYFDQKAKA